MISTSVLLPKVLIGVGVGVGVGLGVTEVLQLLGLQPWLGVHSGQLILASNKQQQQATSNSNKQQQQATSNRWALIRYLGYADRPRPRVPYLRRSYPPSLGPQLLGGARGGGGGG